MYIHYRKARNEDVLSIFNQSKDLIEKYEDNQEINLEAVLKWMNKKIQKYIDEYVCILVNDEIVGYYRLHEEDNKVELDDFYILPSFQNQGIGRIVLEKICTETELPIFLYVFSQNKRVISFYEKFGFEKIEEVSNTRIIMQRNCEQEKYYKAYDKRYKQVHDMNLEWSVDIPSPIVNEIIEKYSITKKSNILELGCGEGRDAIHLLNNGYHVYASDCSNEVIQYCKNKMKKYEKYFMVLDVCKDKCDMKFDFIYSIAVLHMLVLQEDRDAFYRFIKNHLNENGISLILTMGDGQVEVESDISNAFNNVKRIHQETGKEVEIASTSCKMISFESLEHEVKNMGFHILEKGITSIESHFPSIMYIVIQN